MLWSIFLAIFGETFTFSFMLWSFFCLHKWLIWVKLAFSPFFCRKYYKNHNIGPRAKRLFIEPFFTLVHCEKRLLDSRTLAGSESVISDKFFAIFYSIHKDMRTYIPMYIKTFFTFWKRVLDLRVNAGGDPVIFDKVSTIFVEQSSTIEYSCHPPPKWKQMETLKRACTHIRAHLHIRAWGAHAIRHFLQFIIFQFRSTTEQMPALVYFTCWQHEVGGHTRTVSRNKFHSYEGRRSQSRVCSLYPGVKFHIQLMWVNIQLHTRVQITYSGPKPPTQVSEKPSSVFSRMASARVTRWVYDKLAQNIPQRFFCQD
jgi:hypothetical protein